MASAFLTQVEGIALSLEDLQKMNPQTNVIVYHDLMNVQNIREVMKEGSVIILLQIERPDAPTVGHWIALLDHIDHIEHFDSYGFDIDEETQLTDEKHRGLAEILRNETVKTNTQPLQARREGVNTCGRWCIMRTLLKGMTMEEFITLVTQCNIPDLIVSFATMFLDPSQEWKATGNAYTNLNA